MRCETSANARNVARKGTLHHAPNPKRTSNCSVSTCTNESQFSESNHVQVLCHLLKGCKRAVSQDSSRESWFFRMPNQNALKCFEAFAGPRSKNQDCSQQVLVCTCLLSEVRQIYIYIYICIHNNNTNNNNKSK